MTGTAWVTGATGFWGRNVALSLLRLNWSVVALSRSAPQELIAWAEAQDKSVAWLPLDLQQPDWERLTEQPTPQALFHCAAAFDLPLETLLQVNVAAPIQLVERVIPGMLSAGTGRIGVFLGQNGRIGLPGLGHFSATQGALWTWAEAQARQLQSTPLSLSLVFPPRAPSALQGQLAAQLAKPPRMTKRPTAEQLVAKVLAGDRRVGRRPWLAALSTFWL